MEWTSLELMAVVVARELANDELGFIGVGTGRRGFAMGVGIPAVASRLAQRLHAPRFHVMFGPIIDPLLEAVWTPAHATEHNLIGWKGAAQIPVEDALGLFRAGRMDVGFVSGAQVDVTGAVNILGIRREPAEARLPGPLAQPDHGIYAKRVIISAPHTRRHLVAQVDCVTALGHDRVTRKQLAGHIGRGPSLLVTPRSVFDFPHGVARLRSIHPGVSEEQVRDCGFALPGDLTQVPRTPLPSDEELRILRQDIDPHGIWLESRWYRSNPLEK